MFRRLLREYLSLTRGERRGLQILSLLVIGLILVRGFMPRLIQRDVPDYTLAMNDFITFRDSLRIHGERMTGLYGSTGRSGVYTAKGYSSSALKDDPSAELFPFDPNTAGFDSLIRLGVPSGTARTLLNYRQAGGTFSRDSDLLRVYGMRPEIYTRLEPYIRITPATGKQYEPAVKQVNTTRISEFNTVAVSGRNINPFELNRADSLQLIEVYGIGPVFARRIIKYRDLLGGFNRQEQLMEVYGFSLQQYDELSRRSFIDTTLLRKMDLNRLDAAGLSAHPYLTRYHANALVTYRALMGSYRNASQVMENLLLPDSVFMKIYPYLHAGQ